MKTRKTCKICRVDFASSEVYKEHKKACKEKFNRFADVLEKEKNAAALAQPGEEFFKYCNPNPENPCYCCGEDVSTAHVGHIYCKLCPKSFKAYGYLERHLLSVHSESNEFGCKQCNAKCASREILSQHILAHGVSKQFSCRKCGKDFKIKYNLKRHLKLSRCSENPRELLPCELCGRKFSGQISLRSHLHYHMGVDNPEYKCPHCEKAFIYPSQMKVHIRTHTGEKPYPCDLCTKTFGAKNALLIHRRTHTGEHPYRCAHCSFTFSDISALYYHRKTHTVKTPHKCTLCGTGYTTANGLRCHMSRSHPIGEKRFKCEQCDVAFDRRARLDKHVGSTHLKGPEGMSKTITPGDLSHTLSDAKEFLCSQCNKPFGSKPALKIHERTHASNETNNISQQAMVVNDIAIAPDKLDPTPVEIRGVTKSKSSLFVKPTETVSLRDDCILISSESEGIEQDPLSRVKKKSKKKKKKPGQTEQDETIVMSDTVLKERVSDLLPMLIDEEVLTEFGWPSARIDLILNEVIKRWGYKPICVKDSVDYTTRMREKIKILFALTMEDDGLRTLLNDQTIDEVIMSILESK